MNTPVNLDNLRELTEGDKALEAELFKEFISSANGLIKELEDNPNNEKWRTTCHAFKGICVNLGAIRLAEICKDGQEKSDAAILEKQSLLKDIKAEYVLVRSFLNNC